MTRPSVKICCISSKAEALMAIKYGASAIGLVGKMPSGPGVIADRLIYEIVRIIPPSVATFLLTSETQADDILAHHHRTQTTTIQLVDRIQLEQYQRLRDELPGVKLVQVIHVIDHNSVKEAIEVSAFVDAILLDSGNPNLQVKQLGGTGRTHNWDLSRQIRESINIPLFLAGGINKDNVQEAVEQVKPFGIDLCSSVRTNRHLDETKLAAFFSAID